MDRNTEILERILNGETYPRLASHFSVSVATIAGIFERECRKLNPRLYQKLVEESGKGHGFAKINALRMHKHAFLSAPQPWESLMADQILNTPLREIADLLPVGTYVQNILRSNLSNSAESLSVLLNLSSADLLRRLKGIGPGSFRSFLEALEKMGLPIPEKHRDASALPESSPFWMEIRSKRAPHRTWVADAPSRKKFTTKEEVESYFAGDTIECLVCGKFMKSLASHLSRVHGLSVITYKEMFGLPYSQGLVSANTSLRQAAGLRRRKQRGDTTLRDIHEVAHIGQQAPKHPFPEFARNQMSARAKKLGAAWRLTKDQVVAVINAVEITRRSPHVICSLPEYPGHHALHAALNGEYGDLLSRFQKASAAAISIKDSASGLPEEELRRMAACCQCFGLTTHQAAELLGIGKTTAKRYYRKAR